MRRTKPKSTVAAAALAVFVMPCAAAAQDGAGLSDPAEGAGGTTSLEASAPGVRVEANVTVQPPNRAIPPPPPSTAPPPVYRSQPPGPTYGVVAAPQRGYARRPAAAQGYMPSWELFVPGAIAFVNTYGGAVLAAVQVSIRFGGSEVTDWLYVPVVGPFVLTGMASEVGATESAAVFALLGVFQAAGLVFMTLGLAIDRHAGAPADVQGVQVAFAPFVSPTGAGFAMDGRF